MTTNVLTMLPARARLWIYVGFGLLVILQGAADAGFSALQLALPAWLVVASAVLKFLSVPVVALAAVAVSKSPAEREADPILTPAEGAAWDAEYGTSLAEREAAEEPIVDMQPYGEAEATRYRELADADDADRQGKPEGEQA